MTAAGDLVGGRYRLERPIGSGGMATVWRATDEETGQAVAVKLMHPRVQDDPDLLARFRREADVVARIDHPCVVRTRKRGERRTSPNAERWDPPSWRGAASDTG